MQTKTWDKVIVDGNRELSEWAKICQQVARRGVTGFAYANSHYAGHGPATIAQFLKVWPERDAVKRASETAMPGGLFPR